MGKDSTSMDRDELRDLRKLRRETNAHTCSPLERGGLRALQSIVSAAGKAAGLPEELSHPHVLRHAAGYSLINNDVDVRLVQVVRTLGPGDSRRGN
jgi:site-specific recombinase XerD